MIRIGAEAVTVVDVDVHESYASMDVLIPYLAPTWQRYFSECHFRELPRDPYVATAHGGRRADAWPADGGPPGSDYDLLRRQLFDESGIDYAILTGHFYRISAAPQVEFATALASAYNDWLVETWLARDSRLFGSLQLALQDPQAAAREVDRLGGHPQIVQVLFPQAALAAFGHPMWDPLYESVVRNGLHIAIHPSGSTGILPAPTLTGSWPRTYIEYHADFSLTYQAQLASMVCEGTFLKFPTLKIILLEGGFAWLPHVMWSLDTHWRSLQLEVPWLTRRPSELIREHVALGTQPIILPDDHAQLLALIEMIDGEHSLLYASDYPHWDFDSPKRFLPSAVAMDVRRRILGRNALDLYGLPTPDANGIVAAEASG
jgi:predicted TIM-barrel fold metal-dependent hydrolase